MSELRRHCAPLFSWLSWPKVSSSYFTLFLTFYSMTFVTQVNHICEAIELLHSSSIGQRCGVCIKGQWNSRKKALCTVYSDTIWPKSEDHSGIFMIESNTTRGRDWHQSSCFSFEAGCSEEARWNWSLEEVSLMFEPPDLDRVFRKVHGTWTSSHRQWSPFSAFAPAVWVILHQQGCRSV